jgi:DNA-binding LacI/PurR family transcriptional regulator
VLTLRTNGRRPTLEDVARRSGVSKSTVSRVINGEPNGEPKVRAEVVEQVRQVIAKLRYVPNHAARQLVTRRTDAVAVVATQPQNRLFRRPTRR